MIIMNFLLIFSACLGLVSCWIIDPGPQVIATRGEVWPKPQKEEKSKFFYAIRPSFFNFNILSHDCTILEAAIARYKNILNQMSTLAQKRKKNAKRRSQKNPKSVANLDSLDVLLTTACSDHDYPDANMNEAYNLTVSESPEMNSVLTAKTIWGALRGLETFSQLVYLSDDESSLFIHATTIQDFPRFPHRGLLLDTARHYLPVDVILAHLDALSYNKMNVFHWHIVDDQSFPYQSILYPELSERGSYHPSKIYTPSDVSRIIEYARLRGIRVMPEFDTPGHTRSWGEGVPELLTACYDKNSAPTGQFGPMNPSREFLFSFLDEFFIEVNATFPDNFVHLGGDEVPFECWQSNADVVSFMESINITGNFRALEKYYMERLLGIVTKKNIVSVLWEEAFYAGTKTPNDTVIQVWMGDYSSLRKVTEAGSRALFSSCWYLDHLATGGDWGKFYQCDPQNFGGTNEQFTLILGGEACMWGEVVNQHNVLQRTWPRASAVAEKLWSAHNADTYSEAAKRLEEHTCRMNRRGIPAQPPNGPGFCLE